MQNDSIEGIGWNLTKLKVDPNILKTDFFKEEAGKRFLIIQSLQNGILSKSDVNNFSANQ